MLTIQEQNGVIIGTISETDRINAANASELKVKLNELLEGKGVKFILDLRNVKFIDSTGIGALISALKTSRQNDGNFQLCALQKEVYSLLTLMKLDKVFDIS